MVKTIFLETPYLEEVRLSEQLLQYLRKHNIKTIALYASVQFCNNLTLVKEQLKEYDLITPKLKRTCYPHQSLGCNVDQVDIKADIILYLGDGRFHPLALAYAQKEQVEFKPIIAFNPKSQQFYLLAQKDIQDNLQQYTLSLKKFISAKYVGVIITLKPGQERYQDALRLEQKYPLKKFYYFIDNNISFDQLENFNFIDVWVNTACPRIALDDYELFRKGVVNLNDV